MSDLPALVLALEVLRTDAHLFQSLPSTSEAPAARPTHDPEAERRARAASVRRNPAPLRPTEGLGLRLEPPPAPWPGWTRSRSVLASAN